MLAKENREGVGHNWWEIFFLVCVAISPTNEYPEYCVALVQKIRKIPGTVLELQLWLIDGLGDKHYYIGPPVHEKKK